MILLVASPAFHRWGFRDCPVSVGTALVELLVAPRIAGWDGQLWSEKAETCLHGCLPFMPVAPSDQLNPLYSRMVE